jgi:mRNA interferase HigB
MAGAHAGPSMNLIKRSTIEHFARRHADAAPALANWVAMVRAARWTNPDELVRTSGFPARTLPGDRVAFNIHGNTYRLICSIVYGRRHPPPPTTGAIYVKFFGTHAEYNRIDALTVGFRE